MRSTARAYLLVRELDLLSTLDLPVVDLESTCTSKGRRAEELRTAVDLLLTIIRPDAPAAAG